MKKKIYICMYSRHVYKTRVKIRTIGRGIRDAGGLQLSIFIGFHTFCASRRKFEREAFSALRNPLGGRVATTTFLSVACGLEGREVAKRWNHRLCS